MTENKTGNQYRATKIWHEIIESFQTNVPLKRHWRNFRAYSDCFAANEAIEWLYRYLKTSHNFKSQTLITRQQAIQLLQIFLKERIFEDVRGDKYNSKEFQDDDRLYKFCSSDKYNIQYRKTQHMNQNNQNLDPKKSIIQPQSNTATTSITQKHEQIQQQQIQTRRLSLTTKILKEKNLNQDLTTNLAPTTPSTTTTLITSNTTSATITKIRPSSASDYDLINYDQHYSKAKLKESNIKMTNTFMRQQQQQQQHQQELNEIWSLVAINYLYDILKFDSSNTTKIFLDNIHISSSNIQYNCTHVNKHGVVTNANNKIDDLPAWVMQAMTSLVHWNDFKKDHNTQDGLNNKITKAHPSFRDVYNEVNNYFLDHKEPLLTKQLSKLFIKILRIFLQATKQFEIEEFMRNLKEHLSSQTHHQNNDNDFNYIDNDIIDGINDDMNGGGNGECNDICCTQCISTYDFVNNWLNCNEIEFNDFVMNLNANYRLCQRNNNRNQNNQNIDFETDNDSQLLVSTDVNEPDYKRSKINTIDELSNDFERKLRRNNSFIAAITDNNSSVNSQSCNDNITNTSTVSSKNLTQITQMFKTHSLDQIKGAEKIMSKDDLSAIVTKPINIPKRTPSFNENLKIRNMLVNSISLNNIATQIPSKFNKISVGALSSLISSVSLKDINNAADSFTLGFDYDTIKHVIKAFRICSLCLPPINKRKLHLLLRLLYKLKFSEHAKLLVINEFEQDSDNNIDFELQYDSSNIEPIIINSFIKSIISFDENDENVAVKIVQILINNYSEIMRIPDDFLASVQENINTKTSNFCSKISVEQYECEKNDSKQHLIKLLYSILTNVSMTQDEKIKRIRKFKEIYPDIYEEKYATIKKAINVLGINETSKTRYNLAKKRSLNATSINSSDIENNNNSNRTQSNKLIKNLDTTNIFQNLNPIQTASINFPKFLLPKTLKKVRL